MSSPPDNCEPAAQQEPGRQEDRAAGEPIAGFLDWESLCDHSAPRALCTTLRELAFHPARFFDRMSLTGGLWEPLTMFWTLLAAAVLASFPLAMLLFALAAPDPLLVSAPVYTPHLLPPRAAGFAALLLPVTLSGAALVLLAQGSLFHLGATLFGARKWEGSLSVWCYAVSSALMPLLIVELASCLIAACVLAFWGAGTAASRVALWGMASLAGLGLMGGVVLFGTSVLTGCARSLGVSGERGVAGAVAGMLLVVLATAGIGYVCLRGGIDAGLVAAGAVGAALVVAYGLAFIVERVRRRAAPDNELTP